MFLRFISLNYEKRIKIMDSFYDPSFKGAFLRSLTAVSFINQQNLLANKDVLTVCKEQFLVYPVVLFIRKNFYLLKAIDEKIQIFQAAGLIEHWHSKAFIKTMKRGRALSSPTILALRHLSGCFILLTCGLLFSFLVFIIELFMTNIKLR